MKFFFDEWKSSLMWTLCYITSGINVSLGQLSVQVHAQGHTKLDGVIEWLSWT